MPLHSSETRSLAASSHALQDGPVLECASPGTETGEHVLRIRARRAYPVTRDELFAAWTRRAAWDGWMRLRARSRTMLSPCQGGPFRLELAEGPTIHVITGILTEIDAPDRISISWLHHNLTEHASTVDVSFRSRLERSELSLVHSRIASRREAAWLMRLWSCVLPRLGHYLVDPESPPRLADGATDDATNDTTRRRPPGPRLTRSLARSA